MSEEMKPVRCGCGGEAKIQTDHDTVTPGEPIDWKRVVCDNCNIRTTWRYTEAEAITAWNKSMSAKDINVPTKEIIHTIFVLKNGKKIQYFKYNGMKVDLDSRLSIERALVWVIEAMNATIKVEKIEHYSDETYENLIESIELAQVKKRTAKGKWRDVTEDEVKNDDTNDW